MSFRLEEGKLIECKEVSQDYDLKQACRMRDFYKAEIIRNQEFLAEQERLIAAAAELGFTEETPA